MKTYKCLCCGFEQAFASAEEAHEAGWDVSPFFSIQPLCDLCPSAPVMLTGLEGARERHADMHARWKREGRPKEFPLEEELKLNGQSRSDFEEFVKALNGMLAPKGEV